MTDTLNESIQQRTNVGIDTSESAKEAYCPTTLTTENLFRADTIFVYCPESDLNTIKK